MEAHSTLPAGFGTVDSTMLLDGTDLYLGGPAITAKLPAGKKFVKVPIPNATSSPAEGSATLTDEQAADLTAGKYYVNVHTAANPGGEIRGQVTK